MTEKELIIGGCKVRYVEQCSDASTVVYVFLHGWGSDYTIFKSLFGVVDCLLAFDFPGFGGSSPLREPWTLAAYAAVLREFVEKKAGGRKVVFVAHSFGGRVLLHMLSQQSTLDWIQRIICMGVPFARKQKATSSFMAPILGVAKVIVRLLPRSMRQRIRAWWCDFIGAEDYAVLESVAMKKTFQHVIATDMRYLAQSLRGYDTVFLWGADDVAAPIADAAVVAQEVGATLHRIAGGDHFPFLGATSEAFETAFTQHACL
ncbi:MAG: alpha/beta hydrolase [Candidatus Kaiserbacteria bacterium]|nr:alpha/beta hydrolase [Candidatus Kaiserbacteria bacterium]